jgi:Tol biopolymer transport system component
MSTKLKTLILATVLALVAVSAARSTTARWIVVSAGPQHGTQPAQLFRVRTSGSGLEQITTGRNVATDPAFAPNGKRVVFARLSSGIFAVNVDGSGLHRLTGGASDLFPVYSPDGRQIAFLRPYKNELRLYVMHADGRGQRRLGRAPGPAGRPSWTSGGKSIVIVAGEAPRSVFYRVAAADGRVERRLVIEPDVPVSQTVPTLSPNGRVIAYVGRRPSPAGCEGAACEVFALYLERASGGKVERVRDDGGPAGWSADSRTLVYACHGVLRLQPLGQGTAKAIEVGANLLEGDAPPALQPR